MANNNHIFRQSILDFPKQFEWESAVENENALVRKNAVIVAGMGGSHLAGDFLQMGSLPVRLSIHSGYGLPTHIPDDLLRESLLIASSYSGNTEETLDAYEMARERNMAIAIVAGGGELLERAKSAGIPHVDIPNTGIAPRMAVGFQFRALARILGYGDILEKTKSLASALNPEALEGRGKELSEKLQGKIPLVYASQRNFPIAYYWKAILNETGKVQAFYNVFPELCHNEIAAGLGPDFTPVFLRDEDDHERIKKRMNVLKELYEGRGIRTVEGEIEGESLWHKVFSGVLLAAWTAYHLAEASGVEANDVPVIEEFKKSVDRD